MCAHIHKSPPPQAPPPHTLLKYFPAPHFLSNTQGFTIGTSIVPTESLFTGVLPQNMPAAAAAAVFGSEVWRTSS